MSEDRFPHLERIAVNDARAKLGDVVRRVQHGRAPVIMQTRGRDMAALITMAHLRLLDAVLEDLQDSVDLEALAERYEQNPGEIPWKRIKEQLRED